MEKSFFQRAPATRQCRNLQKSATFSSKRKKFNACLLLTKIVVSVDGAMNSQLVQDRNHLLALGECAH